MFAAVWLGGPRWYPTGQSDSTIAGISPEIRRHALRRAMAFIQSRKPGMADLIPFLRVLERKMLATAQVTENDAPIPTSAPFDPNEVFNLVQVP